MCGIAGFINFSHIHNLSERFIDNYRKNNLLLNAVLRRGPDNNGSFMGDCGTVGLVHSLLAITDQSLVARQPMRSLCGQYIIVYNGEIYNQEYLKSKYLSDFKFKTETDTEIILEAFAKNKDLIFKDLEGVFSFAIWDIREQEICLVRDHLGIKPLYYFYDSERKEVGFASLVGALQSCWNFSEQNEGGIQDFLNFGCIISPSTTQKKIFCLPAGSYALFNSKFGLKIQKYFKLEDFIRRSNSLDLRSTLLDVVQSQVPTKVPFGILLSSGVDSNLLAGIARELGCKFYTFTIGFCEQSRRIFSEAQKAKELAKYWGSEHYEWIISRSEMAQLKQEFLDAQDQPSTDGFNSFLAARLASKFCRVVFSGVGADELFLGYWHFEHLNNWLFLQNKFYKNPLYSLANCLNGLPLVKSLLFRSKQFFLLDSKNQNSALEAYLFFRTTGSFNNDATQRHSEELLEIFGSNNFNAWQKFALAELFLYDQNKLLKDIDTMSMYHGVEARVPFLDKRVVSFGLNILGAVSDRKDFYKKFPKQPLTSLLKELCPDYKVQQKQGFELPF